LKQKLKKDIKHKHNIKTLPKDNKNLVLLLGFIIFIISFILYSNTLYNKYALDDFSVIKENWVIKNGTESIPLIFKTSYRYGYWNSVENLYRPLSLVLFAIEWEISPDNPAFYHFINILLYAISGFLLFITLCKVMNKMNIIILFITSLFFIVHPIHTEVVANIKSGDEIISFIFILLTIIFLWKYIEKKSLKSIFISLIFYFLAFLSKESAITMLAVFPLLIYFFTDMTLSKNLKISAVFIIPALIFLAIRKSVLGNMLELNVISIIDNLLVASPDFFYKTATAIKILGIYLLKLVFPHPLAADYSYNQIPIINWSDYKAIISLLIYLLLTFYAIYSFKKKSIFSFCVLFFLVTMSIYSNLFITIGSSFGERFLFVPSLAFCLSFSYILAKLLKINVADNSKIEFLKFFINYKRILIIFLPIFLICSVKTIARSAEWKNDLTLYSADVKKSPNSTHMRYYYGLVLMKDKINELKNQDEKNKYLDLAIQEFKTALKIYPKYADAYDQLGLSYYKKGDNTNAVKNYELALQNNPTKAITYSNMGVIYFNSGNYQKALELYQKAVMYNPRYADAYMNLGSTYGTLGNYQLAVQNFLKSIEYNPDNALVYYFLGITYKSLGDQFNEKKYLEQAYKMDPKLKK